MDTCLDDAVDRAVNVFDEDEGGWMALTDTERADRMARIDAEEYGRTKLRAVRRIDATTGLDGVIRIQRSRSRHGGRFRPMPPTRSVRRINATLASALGKRPLLRLFRGVAPRRPRSRSRRASAKTGGKPDGSEPAGPCGRLLAVGRVA